MRAMSLSAHDPKPDIDDHSIASSARVAVVSALDRPTPVKWVLDHQYSRELASRFFLS